MRNNQYLSDLTDKEWFLIEESFAVSYVKGGRLVKHSKREIVDAIFIFFVQVANCVICRKIFSPRKQYTPIFGIGSRKLSLKQ